ncbi:phosphate ABC transporter ATP-binding protein PstB [Sedimentibacter sp.]|uniref:phosphate ABC transporter ATP-binding protein PstB n=1 Tax=Sedimentibacter sp. TaxID=1960295 RepID=UPI0028AB6E4C|nr:phosphate ABC transporter ATP-binding protein PstB [Sedimentibacter sp.]
MKSETLLNVNDVSCYYGENKAVKSVNLNIKKNTITSFIGPSGCGKTTLLRSINRMNDLVDSFHIEGNIFLEGEDIYLQNGKEYVQNLRKQIGMIFQSANPLPASIYKNMILPVTEHYKISRELLDNKVEEKLKLAALYDEVKGRLHKTALSLSGGQQQRLCIARALMLEPQILLLDEPCSALDPISTYAIEELLMELKKQCTIIIVTHNMQQASRISDYTAFFYQGEVIEEGSTAEIFFNPKTELLSNYITGKI